MKRVFIYGAIGLGAAALFLVAARRASAAAPPPNVPPLPDLEHGGHQGESSFTDPNEDPSGWPVVTLGNEVWQVAPSYVGPIGINEAMLLAKAKGMQLPAPALVDAIWRAADLKLLPLPRQNVVSEAVFADQRRRIEAQRDGRPFTILGGIFKDVVMVNGHPEIYGWHVEDGKTVAGVPLLNPATPGPGKIIQPRSGGVHDQAGLIGFKDYSQGARLVRRIA